jgi:import receptor subunit TOM70
MSSGAATYSILIMPFVLSQKRKSLAQALKTAGNKAYQSRQFEAAIGYYTKAIAAHPLAVFYSNRAACYSNLNRPEDVIPDCNQALAMDQTYVKALNRRAVAREQIGGDGEGEGTVGDEKRDLLFQSLAGKYFRKFMQCSANHFRIVQTSLQSPY